jgi:hypothetical protein
MSERNSMILLSLLQALSGLDKNFPLPYAIFLAEVARNEGCSLADLRKATGMPLPTLHGSCGPYRRNGRPAPSPTA